MGGIEAENLHLAIEEAYQAETIYREFGAQADGAGERFQRLGQDERCNRDDFLTALQTLEPTKPAEWEDGLAAPAVATADADGTEPAGPSSPRGAAMMGVEAAGSRPW